MSAVANRLEMIRQLKQLLPIVLQDLSLTNRFATRFDSLEKVLNTEADCFLDLGRDPQVNVAGRP